jgi:hypothetical protein
MTTSTQSAGAWLARHESSIWPCQCLSIHGQLIKAEYLATTPAFRHVPERPHGRGTHTTRAVVLVLRPPLRHRLPRTVR